jgi:hypothetical protein
MNLLSVRVCKPNISSRIFHCYRVSDCVGGVMSQERTELLTVLFRNEYLSSQKIKGEECNKRFYFLFIMLRSAWVATRIDIKI